MPVHHLMSAMPQLCMEVQRDLAAHYKRVDIQVLDVWKHRGNVELYFKHRYKDFNYRIGSLTEYFQFTDIDAVLNDLRQMHPKVLEPVELDVLSENFGSLCTVESADERRKERKMERSSLNVGFCPSTTYYKNLERS